MNLPIEASESLATQRAFTAMLNAPDVYFFSKNREGKYVFASPGFCEFLGRPPKDILGHFATEFFIDVEREILGDDDLVFRTARRVEREHFVTILLPDGEKVQRLLWLGKVPIFSPSREVIEVLGIIVNNRKHHTMFRFFTHEYQEALLIMFNNPLYRLKGHCESMRRTAGYRDARYACREIADCIRFLLGCGEAYGFLGGGLFKNWKYDSFNLQDPVNAVRHVLEPYAGRKHGIKFAVKGVVNQVVEADLNKLTAIIYLLVSNAIDAIERAVAKVEERIKRNPSSALKEFPQSRRRIEIGLRAIGTRLNLEVRDRGPGLSKEQKKHPERLFELGTSKKREVRGKRNGFGLYIVGTFAQWGGGKAGFRDMGKKHGACCYVEVKCKPVKEII
jgi:signal transduction histidine kinase